VTDQELTEYVEEYLDALRKSPDYKVPDKPIIETGRKLIPLVKYPDDLDFSKTIGGTTYTVNSHFNSDADECLLGIVSRWVDDGTNISNVE